MKNYQAQLILGGVSEILPHFSNKNTCEVKIRDSGEIVKTGGDTEDFLSLDGIQFITYK